jgi:hypothetical protein
MRSKPCAWCGVDFVVNNNEDRKVRYKKYKGKIICTRCAGVFIPAIKRYQRIGESLEKVGCLKRLAKKGRPTGKFTQGCKCAACYSHWLLEIERTSTPAATVNDHTRVRTIYGDKRKDYPG